ncbi:hypothetical protein LSAT2_005618 [Lamellibrachia satsuma]|nr:hypothetical protein LSAT2_005618 [Lamellibrachia satsuma]
MPEARDPLPSSPVPDPHPQVQGRRYVQLIKPGKCPKLPIPFPMVRCIKPINQCNNDGDCPGTMKCCRTTVCGSLVCTRPVPANKPGRCPLAPIRPLAGLVAVKCPPRCRDDTDCPGKKKCCRAPSLCGRVCRDPVFSGSLP